MEDVWEGQFCGLIGCLMLTESSWIATMVLRVRGLIIMIPDLLRECERRMMLWPSSSRRICEGLKPQLVGWLED